MANIIADSSPAALLAVAGEAACIPGVRAARVVDLPPRCWSSRKVVTCSSSLSVKVEHSNKMVSVNWVLAGLGMVWQADLSFGGSRRERSLEDEGRRSCGGDVEENGRTGPATALRWPGGLWREAYHQAGWCTGRQSHWI